MPDGKKPNAESIEYWNDDAGPRWARHADAIDAQLGPFVSPILDRAGIAEGQRVLDVGCGAGALSRAAASLIGESGSVTALDISATLLEVARGRSSLPNVEYRQGDAQVEPFEGGAFDRAISRFGVMFFADSPAAFANLRAAVCDGGSLTFVCWDQLESNPWMGVPGKVVARHVQPAEPPDPDAPGPFRFRNPDYVRELCARAGFDSVDIDPLRGRAPLGGRGSFEAALDFMMEIGPAAQAQRLDAAERDAIRADLGETLKPFATARGVEMDYSAWLVHAR